MHCLQPQHAPQLLFIADHITPSHLCMCALCACMRAGCCATAAGDNTQPQATGAQPLSVAVHIVITRASVIHFLARRLLRANGGRQRPAPATPQATGAQPVEAGGRKKTRREWTTQAIPATEGEQSKTSFELLEAASQQPMVTQREKVDAGRRGRHG
jgi:hypothetical protein